MAEALNFDTGLREYVVNGGATIRLNPTDATFIGRFYETLQRISDRQQGYEEQVREIGDDAGRMLAYIRERTDELCADIDALFGEPVAGAIFPNDLNPYALSGGMPVWVNFFDALADVIVRALEEEPEKATPRVAAQSERYRALLAKYRKRGRG